MSDSHNLIIKKMGLFSHTFSCLCKLLRTKYFNLPQLNVFFTDIFKNIFSYILNNLFLL